MNSQTLEALIAWVGQHPISAGVVIFLSTPQWWFPNHNDAELGWGPIAHVVGNAYLIWGLVLLIAMGTRAFRLGRPDLGGDPEKPVILDGVLAR